MDPCSSCSTPRQREMLASTALVGDPFVLISSAQIAVGKEVTIGEESQTAAEQNYEKVLEQLKPRMTSWTVEEIIDEQIDELSSQNAEQEHEQLMTPSDPFDCFTNCQYFNSRTVENFVANVNPIDEDEDSVSSEIIDVEFFDVEEEKRMWEELRKNADNQNGEEMEDEEEVEDEQMEGFQIKRKQEDPFEEQEVEEKKSKWETPRESREMTGTRTTDKVDTEYTQSFYFRNGLNWEDAPSNLFEAQAKQNMEDQVSAHELRKALEKVLEDSSKEPQEELGFSVEHTSELDTVEQHSNQSHQSDETQMSVQHLILPVFRPTLRLAIQETVPLPVWHDSSTDKTDEDDNRSVICLDPESPKVPEPPILSGLFPPFQEDRSQPNVFSFPIAPPIAPVPLSAIGIAAPYLPNPYMPPLTFLPDYMNYNPVFPPYNNPFWNPTMFPQYHQSQ
ncbi:unnamed protein product [Caenorhabditis sp. 36 PRJEB53466]|nr:unnamed protein product [Caenorhabditis sp. 36 PRJEB53466]